MENNANSDYKWYIIVTGLEPRTIQATTECGFTLKRVRDMTRTYRHYGSVQKLLVALFKLVWNTQKSKWKIFFEYWGKMLLNIEKVLMKISEEQL